MESYRLVTVYIAIPGDQHEPVKRQDGSKSKVYARIDEVDGRSFELVGQHGETHSDFTARAASWVMDYLNDTARQGWRIVSARHGRWLPEGQWLLASDMYEVHPKFDWVHSNHDNV